MRARACFLWVAIAALAGVTVAWLGGPRAQQAPGGSAAGGSRYGGRTYGGRPPADKAEALGQCFEQSVRDRIREGYFVKNDGWIRGIKQGIQDWTPFADDVKGGRCGEYGERGMQWIRPCVDQIFGAGTTVVDDIFVEEKSSVRASQGWYRYIPDSMWQANHRATRVVLPDGRRFVVDYWAAISTGQPRMVPESEWARKWLQLVGAQAIGMPDAVLQINEEQVALRNFVRTYGEERGFEVYRKSFRNLKGDPEIWIRSWQVDPW